MALIQASAQRTLNITIGHFVMAVTSLGAGPRHAAEHRCRGAFRQIFARPAPRGLSLTPGREAFHPMDACRAGPPICLGRAGDACVLGFVERVGDTLYGARVYVKLGRRLADAHAARQSRSDSLSQLIRDRRPAKALTFTLGPL